MAADKNDKISRTANGGIPVVASVTSPRSVGVTTLSVDTQTNWPTGSGIKFSTFKTKTNSDGSKSRISSTQTDWRGVTNGTNTITSMVYTGGLADPGNAVGDAVVLGPTAQWADDFAAAMSNQHNQLDGSHKGITTDTIATTGNATVGGTLTVTTGTTLPNNDIQANELATSAICLGYTQITTNFTTTSTTPVLVTGLTSTVTIPAGGRRIKITVFVTATSNSVNNGMFVTIWDGTVGTGTQLSRLELDQATATYQTGGTCIAVVQPAAGSKTYNVGFHSTNAGTGTFSASSTAPSFLLIEAI